MTFFGDGAMSTGDVHEGLNLAGVWQVPVVFVDPVEPLRLLDADRAADGEHEHRRSGIRGGWCDPLRAGRRHRRPRRLSTSSRAAVERARAGEGPQAVEALTLRGHGHAAHDDARYVPDELRARYGDPIERLAARLAPGRARRRRGRRAPRRRGARRWRTALAEAEAAPAPDPATLEDGVYATAASDP